MSARRRRAGRPVTYCHGGRPGRVVGDLLLPPQATSGASLGPGMSRQDRQNYPGESGWVYVTTNKAFARTHADSSDGVGGGSLYRVELLDRPVGDPDGVPGLDFQCRRARVLAVVERDVHLSPARTCAVRPATSCGPTGPRASMPVTGRWLPPHDLSLRRPEVLAKVALDNARYNQAQALYEQVGPEGWREMRRRLPRPGRPPRGS